MFATKLTTATIAVLLVLAAAGPAAAAGGQADAGGTASQSITVTVTTTADGTTLTFEQAGEAYSEAPVDVETVGDASYRGSGSYRTDANGSIHLPAPEEDVTVRVEFESDGVRASGVVTLAAYHGVETETTVTMDAGAAGQGSTDGSAEDGSAASESSGSAAASADSNGDGHVSLGERISSFIRGIVRADFGGIGDVVSAFALDDNPSDADDGARGGADVNASAEANATADVQAGDGSVDVGAGADAGSGSGGAADARSSGNATASGSANASDVGASAEATGSWVFSLFG